MAVAVLLITAYTVSLSTPDEDRAAVSLCELQPRGALSPREANPPHRTQLSCTALSDRYPIRAQQQTQPCCDIHSD